MSNNYGRRYTVNFQPYTLVTHKAMELYLAGYQDIVCLDHWLDSDGHSCVLWCPTHNRLMELTENIKHDLSVRTTVTRAWAHQDFSDARFYAVYDSKTLRNKDVAHSPQRNMPVLQYTSGNCIATFPDEPANLGMVQSYSPIYFHANSPLTFGEVARKYLQENCKRVSRQQAMSIHPQMFLEDFFDIVGDEKKAETVETTKA